MMNFKNIAIILLVGTVSMSCNRQKGSAENARPEPQIPNAFEKGEIVTNDNFIGTVWLNYLVETDTAHHVNIGSVTFEPGARTNWHYHKGGQILLVTRSEERRVGKESR